LDWNKNIGKYITNRRDPSMLEKQRKRFSMRETKDAITTTEG